MALLGARRPAARRTQARRANARVSFVISSRGETRLNLLQAPPTTRLRARDEDQRRLSEDWPDGAKKRGGSGGSKPKKEKKKPPARALESDDGAKFMLFRVLMLANVPVSFARGSGNVAKLLSAAAHKGAMRARCGTDGRACRMPQAPLLGLEGAPLLARGRLPPS